MKKSLLSMFAFAALALSMSASAMTESNAKTFAAASPCQACHEPAGAVASPVAFSVAEPKSIIPNGDGIDAPLSPAASPLKGSPGARSSSAGAQDLASTMTQSLNLLGIGAEQEAEPSWASSLMRQ